MISLTNITKTYSSGTAKTQALKGVSFTVDRGEFVAIMGPSGSGKSTLMNIIGALDVPTEGTYVLDGKEVHGLTDDQLADIRREKIGFVFQSFNLLRRSSVMRNVMLPMLYWDSIPVEERRLRAEKALHLVDISEQHWGHLSNQLSGGQMQRVAIARALVDDPAIILADEPTGNLDSKTGALVLQTFQNLHAQGRTIVLITHEREVAEHAGRIITVKDGLIESDERVATPRRSRATEHTTV